MIILCEMSTLPNMCNVQDEIKKYVSKIFLKLYILEILKIHLSLTSIRNGTGKICICDFRALVLSIKLNKVMS